MTQDKPVPGTSKILHVSVLLPIFSVLVLGMTRPWREAQIPDLAVAVVVAAALLPALVVYPSYSKRKLGPHYLPVVLSVYLLSQATLSSLLHSLGLVRFDLVQIGPLTFIEPGVLLMIPPLLVAWQYGWRGALLAAAAVGTVHLATGWLLHVFLPENPHLSPLTPILRPDVLFFLPLLVAYLSWLLQKQQKQQLERQNQLREYAATVEVMATERERHRLADHLQATLGHSLSVLNEQLESIMPGLGSLPEPSAHQFNRAHEQVRSDLEMTRQVITDLRSVPLEDLGLEEAIRTRAQRLAERSGIEVDFEASSMPSVLSEDQERVIYHVAEQALQHAEKHEDVRHVYLRLSGIEQYVALTVYDDGRPCGCGQAANPTELDDIDAYARLIGGQLCFDSQEDRGNTLALWLPCRH